jgi:hypothetical protein
MAHCGESRSSCPQRISSARSNYALERSVRRLAVGAAGVSESLAPAAPGAAVHGPPADVRAHVAALSFLALSRRRRRLPTRTVEQRPGVRRVASDDQLVIEAALSDAAQEVTLRSGGLLLRPTLRRTYLRNLARHATAHRVNFDSVSDDLIVAFLERNKANEYRTSGCSVTGPVSRCPG